MKTDWIRNGHTSHPYLTRPCLSVSWTVESEKRYSKDKKDKRKNDWCINVCGKKKTKKDTPFLTIYIVSLPIFKQFVRNKLNN